jgi:uncharacterized membrane protein YebE (DUF533 family)
MSDFNKLIGSLSKSGFLSGLAGGVAGGALTGALTSKKGRKVGKTALKVGALAAVSGLAWKAWQSYSQNQQSRSGSPDPATSPSKAGFDAVISESPDNPRPMLLVRAMIAAAYADGHLDEGERQRIFSQIPELALTTREKAQLFDELQRPVAVEDLARQVTDTETAVEVYAASLLAIDQSQAAARDHLGALARALELPTNLVTALQREGSQQQLTAAV